MIRIFLVTAAIVSLATPTFALAQDAVPQARIVYHREDIATAHGSARLAARIETGIRRACNAHYFAGGLDGFRANRKCRKEMAENARVQVAALQKRVHATKLASAR